jgi:hypothetical protein
VAPALASRDGDGSGPPPAAACRSTRAQALRAALVGGAALGAGALAGAVTRDSSAVAAPSREQDAEILNFLLLLEYAQEALYREAVRRGGLRDDVLTFATTSAPHESEHVAALRRLLGRRARGRPRFDFEEAALSAAGFPAAAIELEEATIAAYIGQGPNLTREVVGDAARIVSVEARHAAWIRDVAGKDPAPRAADPPRSADEVLQDLRRQRLVP